MTKYFHNVPDKYSFGWRIYKTEKKTVIRIAGAFCAPEDQFDKSHARHTINFRLSTTAYKKYTHSIIVNSIDRPVSYYDLIIRNFIYNNKWIRDYFNSVDKFVDAFFAGIIDDIKYESGNTFRCDKFPEKSPKNWHERIAILSSNPFKILFYKFMTYYYEWALL